jgi:hypothetical protein
VRRETTTRSDRCILLAVYSSLADVVLVVHLTFIVFVVLGGLTVARWPKLIWLHVPSAIWGALIELVGLICPLTPLENWLRHRGGAGTYETSFVEHYLMPIVYPEALTRSTQIVLGCLVIAVNVAVYAWVWRELYLRRR